MELIYQQALKFFNKSKLLSQITVLSELYHIEKVFQNYKLNHLNDQWGRKLPKLSIITGNFEMESNRR